MPSRWIRLVVVLGLFVANAAVWIVPSDVARLVARDRHTLLGRYSETHFLWGVGLLAASMVTLHLVLANDARTRRRRAFRLVAFTGVLLPTLVVADVALRLMTPRTYVLDDVAFRRPPLTTWQVVYEDRPLAERSYPHLPPGFGRVECVFTTDVRGFRNPDDRETYDAIALGDSFTEGSRVTDEEAWPARLAALSGRSVGNFGISSYSMYHYVTALRHFGLETQPRWVFCMLYEGNDFRAKQVQERRRIRPKTIFRTSPILSTLSEWKVRTLGSIRSGADAAGLEALSWLPLPVPDGPDARYYAFAPKQVWHLYGKRRDFATGREWKVARSALEALRDECEQAGARLVIIYTPVAARVVLPLAADRLPVDEFRAFVKMQTKRPLPPAEDFLRELFESMDHKEDVVAEWCRAHGVPFLSLLSPLQASAALGEQPYYTYDQHWSPVGQRIAAEAIHRFWQEMDE
jgi:hypothetical protein